MILTVLKTYFKKSKPTIIKYRSYANYDEGSFKTDLTHSLLSSDKCNSNYDEFKNIYMNVLNRHAPIKAKMIRGNNAPFIKKHSLNLSWQEKNKKKLKRITIII